MLSATEDEGLRRRLAQVLGSELRQLAGLLENRVIDPSLPELARQSCLALTALARSSPDTQRYQA